MTGAIEPMPAQIDQQRLAQQLVGSARAEGVELIGPGGLLTWLTKTVLEVSSRGAAWRGGAATIVDPGASR